jgi:nitrogen-specific signal transduction histidine kinase
MEKLDDLGNGELLVADLLPGVVHQLNNLLFGIHSSACTLADQVDLGQAGRENISFIKQNAQAATKLLRCLAQVHPGTCGQRTLENLNGIVADTVEFLRQALPRRLKIETELTPEPLPILVEAVPLRQTILGLSLNLAEAIPEVGALRFSTAPSPPSAAPLTTGPQAPSILPASCLTIAGVAQAAVAPASRRHAPAHPAPPASDHPALRLSFARLFAQNHEGTLATQSRGAKTVFRLCLPQVALDQQPGGRPLAKHAPAQERHSEKRLASEL